MAQLLRPASGTAVIISFLAVIFLAPLEGAADVYRYVDDNQVIHLTNVPAGPKYQVVIREKPLKISSSGSRTDSISSYDDLITDITGRYGIDDGLVKAIIKVESNFNHKAVSKKGAKGLMQLMPMTALSFGVTDCFHPENNIDGGVRYLAYLLGLYNNDLYLALAAYNAGEQAVAKYGGIPPYNETRTYVQLVISNYERYKRQTVGKP